MICGRNFDCIYKANEGIRVIYNICLKCEHRQNVVSYQGTWNEEFHKYRCGFVGEGAMRKDPIISECENFKDKVLK